MALPLKLKRKAPEMEPEQRPVKQIPRAEKTEAWDKFADQAPGSIDINQHLKMLTDVDVEVPEEPMLTVSIKIGSKTFHQALDGVLALRWDNIKKRFEKEEIIKHLGMNAFYSATFLTAATQANTDRERMESFFTVWYAEQSRKAEKAIEEERAQESGKASKVITAAQVEAWVLNDSQLRSQYLAFKKKIADAKADLDMMRGLYNTMQNNGTYLQTLAKLYMTEEYK